jgi:hypothetical protein
MVASVAISDKLPEIILWIGAHIGGYIQLKLTSYIMRGTQNNYDMNYTNEFTMMKAIANFLLLLLLFGYTLYRKKNLGIVGNMENYFNLYIAGMVIYLISFYTSIALSRASLAFTSVQFFLLPQIFDVPEIRKNIVVRFIGFVVFAAYLYLRMYMSLTGSAYVPFNTIF